MVHSAVNALPPGDACGRRAVRTRSDSHAGFSRLPNFFFWYAVSDGLGKALAAAGSFARANRGVAWRGGIPGSLGKGRNADYDRPRRRIANLFRSSRAIIGPDPGTIRGIARPCHIQV